MSGNPTADDTGAAVDAAAPEPLSIGEVLSVLTEEFPDVTVSKIRFLESQGLVTPDRNASGYRQFGDSDIERLRWILRQQRDKFLPLKVIKRALDSGVEVVDAGAEQPTLWTAVADDAVERLTREDEGTDDAESVGRPSVVGGAGNGEAEDRGSEVPPERDGSVSARARAEGSQHPTGRVRHATPADVVAALQEDPRPPAEKQDATGRRRDATAPGSARGAPDAAGNGAGDASGSSRGGDAVPQAAGESYGRSELMESSGITLEALEALEEFGLLRPSDVAGEPEYDATDLLVCSAAARCGELGLGARHLRIYKVSAVREAGLVEQLVMPLVKQRNPEARAQAERTVDELTDLGARVHAALLARELGPLAPPRR